MNYFRVVVSLRGGFQSDVVISHVPRWRRLSHSLTFVRNDKSITTLNYIFPKLNTAPYVVMARLSIGAALIVLCLYVCISYKIFHIFVYKSYKPLKQMCMKTKIIASLFLCVACLVASFDLNAQEKKSQQAPKFHKKFIEQLLASGTA